jgi:UPF0755 protein
MRLFRRKRATMQQTTFRSFREEKTPRRVGKPQILVLLVLIGVGFWFVHGMYPVDLGDATPIDVSIAQGTSVDGIAKQLHEKDLIRSVLLFKLYVKYKNLAETLKAGGYTMNRAQSMPQIVGALAEGKSADVSITIPEGYTVADIDALLASRGLGKAGDIVACAKTCDFPEMNFLPPKGAAAAGAIGTRLEGYLFPDTYYVATVDYDPRVVLDRMLGNFRTRIMDVYAVDIQTGGKTLPQILTMASLVQEESGADAEERATVSGILWKRMENGIGLGVDATVRYALSKPKAALTRTDLDTDSPYNTRKYAGLPPTPIANPGEAAIKAALHPVESGYWYYLHGTDGLIRYAKTNDEHNENKAKYLR